MNVLMIGIGDSILTDLTGDTLERHLEYAKKIGYIDLIVFSTNRSLRPKHFERLSIYPTGSINKISFVFDVLRIAQNILKIKNIDVITTQDPFGTGLAGFLLKKRYKIPLHVQNHSSFLNNYLWINEKPILFRIFNILGRFIVKNADRLRVVNKREKEIYINLGINSSIIDVAPIPINLIFWLTPPSEKEIQKFIKKNNIPQKFPILSWVGRFVKVKDLPFLFKSLRDLKNITLLLAGDYKSSYWNLDKLLDIYNIKPIFLGKLSHNDLKILYYITDIYLHSSIYEGFGRVMVEAQACGCPVVSRESAGSMEIIDDGRSGFIVKDENEFTEKIKFLLNNPQKRLEMGKYAKEMVKKKFDYNILLDKVINSIVKTKNT